MDLGTILGALIGSLFIIAAISMHGRLSDFVDLPGALVAFGGSFSALFIYFPAKKVLGLFSVVNQCLINKLPNLGDEARRLAEFATLARRDGLLALEKEAPGLTDPFLRRGLDMLTDGTPKDKIEQALNIELACIQERHATGKRMFEQLGASLPAFGMVGTLIGLIQMLHQLDDPSKIGTGMAVAMVTTFYGALVANMICLPIAGKLDNRSKEESLLREMMILGVLALTEGEAPRSVEAKLNAFLAPKARQLDANAA